MEERIRDTDPETGYKVGSGSELDLTWLVVLGMFPSVQ